MKTFDTISKIERDEQPIRLSFDDFKPLLKKKKSPYFYFFKSAQIVISAWIVTVVAITATPWLDYYVKTSINHNEQVLGDQAPAETVAATPEAVTNVVATFSLKNSKIEIKAPIIEGIGEDSLKMGIGHHPESVWPGVKGNVVLAGHNTDLDAENPYARVFLNLRNVSIGDQVVINYRNKNYYYKVFKNQTVAPSDTSLFQNSDDWMLTFYTCDPPYTDWKRLVFQAKLEKIE